MATLEQCRAALDTLAAQLATNAEAAGKLDFDRTLGCQLTDLDDGFHGKLVGGKLQDIEPGDDPKAKIRLIISSDDLIELTSGRLDAARAFTSGRLKIKANPFDLLKLRKLL